MLYITFKIMDCYFCCSATFKIEQLKNSLSDGISQSIQICVQIIGILPGFRKNKMAKRNTLSQRTNTHHLILYLRFNF